MTRHTKKRYRPEIGDRVSGVEAEPWIDGGRLPALKEPRSTAVGTVRAVYPHAPTVVVVLDDNGNEKTVRAPSKLN